MKKFYFLQYNIKIPILTSEFSRLDLKNIYGIFILMNYPVVAFIILSFIEYLLY